MIAVTEHLKGTMEAQRSIGVLHGGHSAGGHPGGIHQCHVDVLGKVHLVPDCGEVLDVLLDFNGRCVDGVWCVELRRFGLQLPVDGCSLPNGGK